MNDRSSTITKIRNPKSPIHLHHHNTTKSNHINNPQFKMARKSSFLKPTLIFALLLFFLAIYSFIKASTTSTTASSSSSSALLSQLTATDILDSRPKVRVFMYDLPSKFTTGIIERHALARGHTDLSKLSYPGHQHMGEWYLYQDILRPEEDRARFGSVVTRVDDPEEADLFYVPVFSSLSLIVNTASGKEYSDEEMQESLMEWLELQEYWRRNNGRDHVIMAGDPNALYRILDRVKNAILLLSDFGRVRPDQGSLVKDIIVPYAHRISTYGGEIGVEKRDTLLFFMGNRYRKDGGKIRDLLFQLLENEEGVLIKHGTQSRENRRAATHGMHTSKFCLNPAGDTPSACRLFDAIVSLCVPVIVSDSIELPFEDVLDYRKIAIFVETKASLKPGYLVQKLRSVSTERILEYQRELKEVKRYFDYGDPNGTVKEIWREVSHKLPLIRLMINRDKRLVKRDLRESDCSCLCTNETGFISNL